MMKPEPLDKQTIVITGASSGIGLVTARMAAREGARLVLAARNGPALAQLTRELTSAGNEAIYVVADVGDRSQVERIAERAVDRFGGFDTWINNAGVSIFGALHRVKIADMQRLFDTNFWGVVHGSLTALAHFRKRGAGKIVNVGSLLGERAIPTQGIYSASKHAVAGFTESLRIEVDSERLPVSISLIKPASIDTPYKDHARNYLPEKPAHPPPTYEPEVVAEAIIYACENDVRDLVVGGSAQLISTLTNIAPRWADHAMALLMPYLQRSSAPAGAHEGDNLYSSARGLIERTGEPWTLKRSTFTKLQMHPYATILAALSLALAAGLALKAGRRSLEVYHEKQSR